MLFQSKLILKFFYNWLSLSRSTFDGNQKKKKNRLLLTGNEASLSDYVAISVCDRMRTPDNNDMCAIGIQESCSVFFLNEKPLWHKYFFKIVSRWLENHGKKNNTKIINIFLFYFIILAQQVLLNAFVFFTKALFVLRITSQNNDKNGENEIKTISNT